MTAPARLQIHICIDCKTLDGEDRPRTVRPCPYPGPRCDTHGRAFKRGQRARAHLTYVQKTYGLQPGEYEAMYELQGGKCAICQIATGKARRLAVDHDHETGAPRGLLCNNCNKVVLGFDGGVLARAIAYLADPTYAQLQRGGR